MKRKLALFVLVAMMASMLVIPQVLAATGDGLFYRPNVGDRFYFDFYLMYGGDVMIDEVIYMEITDPNPSIPDPLTNLTDLPFISPYFYYKNGTPCGLEILALAFMAYFEYPVGNWSLISELAPTDLPAILPFEPDDLTVVQDDVFWGIEFTGSEAEVEASVEVDYSKFDGVFANYRVLAHNTTTSELIAEYRANRFEYHGLSWGFSEGDKFYFHLVTTGEETIGNIEEDIYLEVAEESLAVIPYDLSAFSEIPYFGYTLNWMNDTPVSSPYLMYTLKAAVPIGNWTHIDTIAEELDMYDDFAIDDPDIYFWGYSWSMTMFDTKMDVHTDYLKIDGMVAHHTMTITNITSSEVMGSISIERFNLEPYTDRTDPTVTTPDDVTFVEGTTGHNITWTLNDENPTTYQVLVNGTAEASGSWTDGTDIVLDLDDFEAGVYNCTIVAYDIAGNMVIDTVMVTVTASGGGITNFLMDNLLYIAIGVGAIVIIGAVVCIRRRK